ncbi:MAG: RNA-binding S4 domain-containing protein [Gemmatirosa sp.]
MSQDRDGSDEKVRLDKWLWAARFYKTRSLATEAVDGGKVDVNGARAKPAKLVGPGDELRVTVGPQRYVLRVTGTGERRGSAEAARTLYEETAESQADRAKLAEQHRLSAMSFDFDAGRPNKKDRRDLNKFRER